MRPLGTDSGQPHPLEVILTLAPPIVIIQAQSYRARWYTLLRANVHTAGLQRGDREVLAWLASHSPDYKPTLEQACEDLGGFSLSTWERSVKRLREAGWLTVERERRHDGTWNGEVVYIIHHPESANEAEEILWDRGRGTAVAGSADCTTDWWSSSSGKFSAQHDASTTPSGAPAASAGESDIQDPFVTSADWRQTAETSDNFNDSPVPSHSAEMRTGADQATSTVLAADIRGDAPLIENSGVHTPSRARATSVPGLSAVESTAGLATTATAKAEDLPGAGWEARWKREKELRDLENVSVLRAVAGDLVVDVAPNGEVISASRVVQGLVGAGWTVEALSDPTLLGGCADLTAVRRRALALLGKTPVSLSSPGSQAQAVPS